MTAVTMRIGGVEVPLAAMLERPEIGRVTAEPVKKPEPFTFSFEIRSTTSARALFDALKMPQPRHRLTLTRKRRDGSAIVDVVEVDRIDVVIARRGLKRPGQWTDATRARRHKRLVRAAQRRAREWSVRAWHRFNASSGRRGRREQERLLDDRFAGEEPSS